jgi:choline dehydrogenase
MSKDEEYDVVVVGAGAAGCALVRRLSDDPAVEVLVLEAGHAHLPENVDIAPLWFTLLGSEIDWGYSSVPQPGLNGRASYEPRGKAPGGSSNLYIMMHIRGHASDFDNWAYHGAAGWSYEECVPYFQRVERQEDDTNPTAGRDGAQTVSNAGLHDPNPTSAAFIEAAVELGHARLADFNSGQMVGTGWHHINVKNGRRDSAFTAYLEPVLDRRNVTLRTSAQATRLLFEGTRCVGVEYLSSAPPEPQTPGRSVASEVAEPGRHQVRARHEVIVTCGAIESPKLLQLSGLGNPSLLGEHGIAVLQALPGVGENFHNHVLTGVIQEASQPVPPPTQNLSEAALFLHSQPGLLAPDIQIAFVHVPFDIIVGRGHPNAVSILPGVVRPTSRGWVRLASADPLAKPLVHPNYLGDRADLERMVQGVQIARDLFGTLAFSPWVKQELMPGPEVSTPEQLVAFVRGTSDSYHHQAGSCRMGIDDLAVVDPRLRVHGVTGLRVADASVMPAVPSGNCHAAILMIAERCAEWVLQDLGS